MSNLNIFKTTIENVIDKVISRPTITSKGLTWSTVQAAFSPDRIIRTESENLYNGTAGITYFLCKAYAYFPSENVQETIARATDWLINFSHDSDERIKNYHTGQLGMVEALLQSHRVTDDSHAMENAKRILTRGVNAYFDSNKSKDPSFCNLCNGASGALIATLRLFEQWQDEEILGLAQKLIGYLISRARIAETGIYWDRLGDSIRPSCTFANGNAGVCYALSQAYQVIPDPTIPYLIQQGIAYENSWVESSIEQNWPNFYPSKILTKNPQKAESALRKAILKKDKGYFFTSGSSGFWDDGNAGIALSRLACRPFIEELTYELDIQRAENRITKDVSKLEKTYMRENFGLCHGYGGIAFACIELGQQENSKLLKCASDIAALAIRQKEQTGRFRSSFSLAPDVEDISLFNGECGIATMLLRVLEQEVADSILAPKIKSDESDLSNRNGAQSTPGFKQILAKAFSNSYAHVEEHYPDLLNTAEERMKKGFSLRNSFQRIAYEVSDVQNDTELKDKLDFEQMMFRWDQSFRSDRYIKCRQALLKEKNNNILESISDEKLLLAKLVLADEVKLSKSKSRYLKEDSANGNESESPYFYLIHRKPFGVGLMPLPEFNYSLLNQFAKANKVKNVIDSLTKLLSASTIEEKQKVKTIVINQVKEALMNGMLEKK